MADKISGAQSYNVYWYDEADANNHQQGIGCRFYWTAETTYSSTTASSNPSSLEYKWNARHGGSVRCVKASN